MVRASSPRACRYLEPATHKPPSYSMGRINLLWDLGSVDYALVGVKALTQT
jgi:hypothetical protein